MIGYTIILPPELQTLVNDRAKSVNLRADQWLSNVLLIAMTEHAANQLTHIMKDLPNKTPIVELVKELIIETEELN